MPQQIVYTNESEDSIVKKFAKKWSISKAETIKRIIRDFGRNNL
jgi:hypothetical protein